MSPKKSIKIFVEDADNEPVTEEKVATEINNVKEPEKAVKVVKAVKTIKVVKPKSSKKKKETKRNVVDLGVKDANNVKLFSALNNDVKKVSTSASSKKKETVDSIQVAGVVEEKDKEMVVAASTKESTRIAQVAGKTEVATEPQAIEKSVDIDELLFEKSSAVKKVINESKEAGASKEKEQAVSAPENASVVPKLKLYKRIVYFFVFLTFALILFVSYFLFVKVDIVLIPNQERVSNNMIFDVIDKDNASRAGTNSIKGVVKKIDIEKEEEFVSSGEEVVGKEAIGKIVIVNNYIKNQPLVASTRILAADGKLFRLKNTINIPAGSSVETEIYADEASPEMAIGATRFSIPGLWAGLQDKIYAESKDSIVFQKQVKKHVLESDIENAVKDLKLKILTATKEQVNEEFKDYGQILYKIDENTIKSEVAAKAGDEVDSFKAVVKAEVVIVAFNNDQAITLSKQKFISTIPAGKEMISFDESKIIYALENYDIAQGSAMVNANFEGKISLKSENELTNIDKSLGFSKEKLLGLNEAQLNTYLKSIPDIAGFEVKFFPSFIKKVPNINDRVNLQIKK